MARSWSHRWHRSLWVPIIGIYWEFYFYRVKWLWMIILSRTRGLISVVKSSRLTCPKNSRSCPEVPTATNTWCVNVVVARSWTRILSLLFCLSWEFYTFCCHTHIFWLILSWSWWHLLSSKSASASRSQMCISKYSWLFWLGHYHWVTQILSWTRRYFSFFLSFWNKYCAPSWLRSNFGF